jgi:hypothetical protein
MFYESLIIVFLCIFKELEWNKHKTMDKQEKKLRLVGDDRVII